MALRDLLAWPIAASLALIAAVAFAPGLGNQFVNWDDDINFLYNPAFRGLGLAQLGWAWTTPLLGTYQPLGWMLAEAEYAAWGLRPMGYHATSLALHAACTVVLYALVLRLLALG